MTSERNGASSKTKKNHLQNFLNPDIISSSTLEPKTETEWDTKENNKEINIVIDNKNHINFEDGQ